LPVGCCGAFNAKTATAFFCVFWPKLWSCIVFFYTLRELDVHSADIWSVDFVDSLYSY
jgi:hypothetical protein